MKKKTHYIAALMLAAGGTMTAFAGPGVGAYGPWNSGGAFGGFGPYQPYVARGCDAQETRIFLKRATCSSPVRMRTITTPAPVAETILEAPAPVAERVIIRRTRLVRPVRTVRVTTCERIERPRTFHRVTRVIPRRNLDVVGERCIAPIVAEPVVTTPAPACGLSPDWDYANPYQ